MVWRAVRRKRLRIRNDVWGRLKAIGDNYKWNAIDDKLPVTAIDDMLLATSYPRQAIGDSYGRQATGDSYRRNTIDDMLLATWYSDTQRRIDGVQHAQCAKSGAWSFIKWKHFLLTGVSFQKYLEKRFVQEQKYNKVNKFITFTCVFASI